MKNSARQILNRIAAGIGANVFGQIVTAVIQIFSVPIFFKYWGAQKYGEWLMLSTIPIYLGLSDIGFASVAANKMTMLHARGETTVSKKIFHSGILLIGCIAIVVVFLVAVISFNFNWNKYLKIQHLNNVEVGMILTFLAMQAMIGLIGGMVLAGFRANGDYAEGVLSNNVVRLTEWVCSIFVILHGYGIVAVALSYFAARLIGTICMACFLWRKGETYRFGIREFEWDEIRRLLKPALGFMAFPVGTAVNLQGMALIVGYVLGPATLAVYNAYRTYSRVLLQAMVVINQPLWPELSMAYGTSDYRLANTILNKATKISISVGVIGILLFGFLAKFVMTTLLANKSVYNPTLLWLLLCVSFFNVVWQSKWIGLLARNAHQQFAVVFLSVNVLALLIGIPAVNGLGLYAVPVILCFVEIILAFMVNLNYFSNTTAGEDDNLGIA